MRSSKCDCRLDLRIAASLLEQLQAAANEEGRKVSDVARRILVAWAAERTIADGGQRRGEG